MYTESHKQNRHGVPGTLDLDFSNCASLSKESLHSQLSKRKHLLVLIPARESNQKGFTTLPTH